MIKQNETREPSQEYRLKIKKKITHFTHLNKLGVVQPLESMPSPSYYREFLHAVHHHRPLFWMESREQKKLITIANDNQLIIPEYIFVSCHSVE